MTKSPFKKKLLQYLDDKGVKYHVKDHKRVYTAYDLANTLKEELGAVAKTVMVEADDKENVIAVLPSNRRVNLTKLAKAIKKKGVKIVREQTMAKKHMTEAGALTAFGKMYKDLPVYVDRSLTKAKKVIASTGDFESSLHMTAKEFLKATDAALASFSDATGLKLQGKPKKKVGAKKTARKTSSTKKKVGAKATAKKRAAVTKKSASKKKSVANKKVSAKT